MNDNVIGSLRDALELPALVEFVRKPMGHHIALFDHDRARRVHFDELTRSVVYFLGSVPFAVIRNAFTIRHPAGGMIQYIVVSSHDDRDRLQGFEIASADLSMSSLKNDAYVRAFLQARIRP